MNTVLIIIIIAVIAAVGGAWWYQNYSTPAEPEPSGLEINIGETGTE